MSRRREQGADITWLDAFGVVKAPAFGAIVVLGLVLLAIFLLWLAAAWAIYAGTLGPAPPTSLGAFVRDVLTTGAGWAMIVVGNAVGWWVLSRSANPQPSQGIAPWRRLWPGPTASSTSTSVGPCSGSSGPAPRSARSPGGSAGTRPRSTASWAATASAT